MNQNDSFCNTSVLQAFRLPFVRFFLVLRFGQRKKQARPLFSRTYVEDGKKSYRENQLGAK